MEDREIADAKYLIIGNSAGGISAAEAIREQDGAGSITIISDEPYAAYSRILISKYLTKERDYEQTQLRPADFYEKNNITLLKGRRVVKLLPGSKSVEMENGERVYFDKLLLATGGSPIVTKIEGLDKKGVFTYTMLDDVKAIDEYMAGVKNAVIIGAGLIGISAAEALAKLGIGVTVIVRSRIMRAMLDEYASSVVGKTLTDAGVNIVTGHTASSVAGNDKVEGVVLDDGSRIPCQMLVVAIGVLPRIDLVKNTDIQVENGIVVDLNMQTTHDDVYACGDVAEVHDFIHGENRVIPIWPGAHFGGRVAGLNMAGCQTEYRGCTAMNTMGYFGLNVASGGIVNPPDDSYEVLSSNDGGNYQRLVLKDNAVVGMLLMGNIDKSGIIINMMRDGVDVGDFKDKLISEDASGLTYLLWKLRSWECKY